MAKRQVASGLLVAAAALGWAGVPKNCLDPDCILPLTRLGLSKEQVRELAAAQLDPERAYNMARAEFSKSPSEAFQALRLIKAADWAGRLPETISALRGDPSLKTITAVHYAMGIHSGGIPVAGPQLPPDAGPLWRLIAVGAAASGGHILWTRRAGYASIPDFPREARLHELIGCAYAGFLEQPLSEAQDTYGPLAADFSSIVRPDLAARHFQMAIWLEPSLPNPYFRLSLALYRTDRARSEVAMARFISLSATRLGARHSLARQLFPSLAGRL